MNTLDGQTIAVDAASGKELWRTKIGDINLGETITMAPLVAKGKVFVGNSGGEYGVRGKLVALDARSGREVWRAYSTGPDRDVLIGPNFKPFYAQDQGKDLGVSTWPPEAWKIGGGTVWGFLSYDPDLDLLYYGTANPGPWNPAAASRRQQVHVGHLRAQSRHRRGALVLPAEPRTTCTTTTASTRTCSSTCRSTARRARC